MKTERAKRIIEQLLSPAGIRINGNNPWDLEVYNNNFFNKVLIDGSLAVGETYMENWWDCPRLDEFYARVLKVSVHEKLKKNWKLLVDIALTRFVNLQTTRRSLRSIHHHYDLDNNLFAMMLDKRMIYSCAYWKDARNLDEAQEKKLELTCRKLNLEPGMTVLDIGCGWGGFARYATENFKVTVTGITASAEQASLAKQLCCDLPVDIRCIDYRNLEGKYDRIVSLGMFEHVGYKNYDEYMQVVYRSLKDDGLFLLHTIGSNVSSTWTDPWLNNYIFPGALLPSVKQIAKSVEGRFVMEDWHNFSADYDKTLMAWYHNFVSHQDKLGEHYGERFRRMWTYYLLCCAGSFRARKNQLWQIVFSKNGVPGGYISVR